jgi:hypothetical protein
VGTPGALTNSGLSSGWQVGAPHPLPFRPFTWVQVWGGAAPSPQRNVSASSAPATTDPLSTQGEVPFRSNMTEGWRSNSGTWADSDAGEFALVSFFEETGRNSLPRVYFRANANLYQGRPRQVSVAQGVTFSPRTVSQQNMH